MTRLTLIPVLFLAMAARAAELPRYTIDTTWTPAKITVVKAGSDLQAAINAAAPGEELLLEAGATFSQVKLPAKNNPSGTPIVIRSNQLEQLPLPGTRISPDQDAPHMPKIVATNSDPALWAVSGASFYRIVGVELTYSKPTGLLDTVVHLAPGSHHITLDRTWIHGPRLAHVKRGVGLNGATEAVVDSYISEIHGVGQDSQAIGGWEGNGPFKIVNNYLEAAGENILFGGSDPVTPGAIASDVEIRGNLIKKPLTWMGGTLGKVGDVTTSMSPGGTLPAGTYYYRVAGRGAMANGIYQSDASDEQQATTDGQSQVAISWAALPDAQTYRIYRTLDAPSAPSRAWMTFDTAFTTFTDAGAAGTVASAPPRGTHWSIKNLLESKAAHRLLVDGNIFDGSWVDAQVGYAIVIKSANQGGGCTWCESQDVTIRNNRIRNVQHGFTISDWEGGNAAASIGKTARVTVDNNLVENFLPGDSRFFQIHHGISDIWITNNTGFTRTSFIDLVNSTGGLPMFRFEKNLVSAGNYGIHSDSAMSEPALTLHYGAGNYSYSGNVIVKGPRYKNSGDNQLLDAIPSLPYAGAGVDLSKLP